MSETSERGSEKGEPSFEERFAELYSGGRIMPVEYAELPDAAVSKFEGYSRRFISPEEYRPNDFSGIWKIVRDDGSETFVAEQDKDYGDGKGVERLVYLIDMLHGREVGHGELRRSLRPPSGDEEYFTGKPFVGYSGTESEMQGKGLGRRRLIEMDAISRARYGAPLNSDTLLTDDAIRVWERLVEDGLAEHYQEGKHTRYRMMRATDNQGAV